MKRKRRPPRSVKYKGKNTSSVKLPVNNKGNEPTVVSSHANSSEDANLIPSDLRTVTSDVELQTLEGCTVKAGGERGAMFTRGGRPGPGRGRTGKEGEGVPSDFNLLHEIDAAICRRGTKFWDDLIRRYPSVLAQLRSSLAKLEVARPAAGTEGINIMVSPTFPIPNMQPPNFPLDDSTEIERLQRRVAELEANDTAGGSQRTVEGVPAKVGTREARGDRHEACRPPEAAPGSISPGGPLPALSDTPAEAEGWGVDEDPDVAGTAAAAWVTLDSGGSGFATGIRTPDLIDQDEG